MRRQAIVLLAVALGLAAPATAGPAPSAELIRRYPAPEAHQGVAVDARSFYAVANSAIVRYDKKTGKKQAQWAGDPKRFRHLNSCAVIGPELVCANSNFPQAPMRSSVEMFEPTRLVHLRSIPLGEQPGSLTWVDRHDGAWWAGFANYDGHGGVPGRDHRATRLVRFDDRWRPVQSWTFPDSVLERMKPSSASGGAWGADGRLYVTGHDRPELYVLAVPPAGGVLVLQGTIALPFGGQAFAFDRSAPGVLFGVSRQDQAVLSVRLP
ncbi:MAG: hypothetical protein JWO33_1662 [Caulobacteraceae bacterium]|nr:hypothetical protein [Caulobacteraceae bacterium]